MFAFRSSLARVAYARPAASVLAVSPARALSAVAHPLALQGYARGVVASRPRIVSGVRCYSLLTHADAKDYKYEDIKKLVAQPVENTLLVDVREPSEYAEGHIPGAVNVPFKSSPGAFGLTPEEFSESFGFSKPGKDTELIFYCLGGVRSSAAEELANSFGYSKRGNYLGSYEDWISRENSLA